MILKASQRGGGKQLGHHLTRTDDNEHVEIHEIRGFVSDDVTGAFKESYAVSKGTKCKQHLFSVSLNPPEKQQVSVDVFENTIDRIEKKNNLHEHPRVVVFHEKEGRRHAHAVWSRIDADTMTAKNLSHYKLKMRDISREVYLEQGWKMPKGLMNSKDRDPRNFSLAEWQQAKRMGVRAQDIKSMMQECWAVSDSKTAFQQVLKERGFQLAKGDRRGFVAISPQGEVLSIARYASKKAKEVRAKLGEPDNLPNIEETRRLLAETMGKTLQRNLKEARLRQQQALTPLDLQRQNMVKAQRKERHTLDLRQKQRWQMETKLRSKRFQKGIKGVIDHVTGTHKKLHSQNMLETHRALQRDRQQKQDLISAQLKDRQKLQSKIKVVRDTHAKTLIDLRRDKQYFKDIEREPATAHLKPQFERLKQASRANKPAERLKRLKEKTHQVNEKTHRPPSRGFDRER